MEKQTTMQMNTVKNLIEQGYAFPALLPDMNDYLLSREGKQYRNTGQTADNALQLPLEQRLGYVDLTKLDSLDGYTIPLMVHDYAAKTPIMWNTLYQELGLNVKNIMIVADPENIESIMGTLKNDPKYLGGGFAVGFKEQLFYLDKVVPRDLKAVNIVVKENGELIGYNTDAKGLVKSIEDKFSEINKSMKGSTIVLLGAGGVAKETARELARKGVSNLAVLNRTKRKATNLAYEVNKEHERISTTSGGENVIRGLLLNSFEKPDVVINATDKGADGPLEGFAAFAATGDLSEETRGNNEYISRTIARELRNLNPDIIVADIVLPKSGKSITLRICENEGLKNLIDGKPMVVNQAGPAYVLVQNAHLEVHSKKVTEEKALEVFKKTAG